MLRKSFKGRTFIDVQAVAKKLNTTRRNALYWVQENLKEDIDYFRFGPPYVIDEEHFLNKLKELGIKPTHGYSYYKYTNSN